MTKLTLLRAAAASAAVVAAVLASPANAQPVISDPGYCAQFYPDANCDNLGPGNPYTGDYQSRANDSDNSYAMDGQDSSYCAGRYRSYDPASGTYLGYDGRRHPCQ